MERRTGAWDASFAFMYTYYACDTLLRSVVDVLQYYAPNPSGELFGWSRESSSDDARRHAPPAAVARNIELLATHRHVSIPLYRNMARRYWQFHMAKLESGGAPRERRPKSPYTVADLRRDVDAMNRLLGRIQALARDCLACIGGSREDEQTSRRKTL